MSINSKPGRIEHLPVREGNPAVEVDERTVLRLSRESLRGNQPAVRFIDKIDLSRNQRALPWLV